MSLPKIIGYVEGIKLDGTIWKRIIQLRQNVLISKEKVFRFSELYYRALRLEAWKSPDVKHIFSSTFGATILSHEISFNEIRNTLPEWRLTYIASKNSELYELPFSYGDPHFSFQYIDEKEILTQNAIKELEEPIGVVVQRIIDITNNALSIYKESLNTLEKQRRLNEREIKASAKYKRETFIRIYNCYQTTEFDGNIVSLEIDAENKKNDYLNKLDDENNVFTVGILRGSGIIIPLELALLPIPGQPLRLSIKELKQVAINNNPELPERQLTNPEMWCLARADKINSMNFIANEARVEYNETNCVNNPTRRCKWLGERISNAEQNMVILDRKIYPDDLVVGLFSLSDYIAPTQKDLDLEQIELSDDECRRTNVFCVCVIRKANMVKQYTERYSDTSTQEGIDLKEVVLAHMDVNIASCSEDSDFSEKRDRWIALKNAFVSTYGYEPTYDKI